MSEWQRRQSKSTHSAASFECDANLKIGKVENFLRSLNITEFVIYFESITIIAMARTSGCSDFATLSSLLQQHTRGFFCDCWAKSSIFFGSRCISSLAYVHENWKAISFFWTTRSLFQYHETGGNKNANRNWLTALHYINWKKRNQITLESKWIYASG